MGVLTARSKVTGCPQRQNSLPEQRSGDSFEVVALQSGAGRLGWGDVL